MIKKYNLYVLGLVVVFVVFFIWLIVVKTKADTTTLTARVFNSPPSIDTATVNTTSSGSGISSLNLTENATTTLYIYGTFTDNNGCAEITSGGRVRAFAYRSDSGLCSLGLISLNDRLCYAADSAGGTITAGSICSMSGCSGDSDFSGSYLCQLPLQFFADATDVGGSGEYETINWTATVVAVDAGGSNSSLVSYSGGFEINSITSIFVTGTVDYGTLVLGTTSTVQSVRINNVGNNNVTGANIAGQPLTCVTGTIATTRQYYTTSSNSDPSYSFSTTAQSLRISIPKQSQSNIVSSSTIRMTLSIPVSGILGVCSSTVSFVSE